jgi:hypothetical protein
MYGGGYVVICLCFALAGGIVGRLKGSSFLLWFLISGAIPVLGLAAALLSRVEDEQPRRICPGCGQVRAITDAICSRCATELDFPGADELVPSRARIKELRRAARERPADAGNGA